MVEFTETAQEDDSSQPADRPTGRRRERSLIEFPYTDLERSVELARTLLTEGGQAKIEITQLAVAMNQSSSGGTFRGRLSAGKMFGLVDSEQGQVWLTPLGLQITDEREFAAASAEAFLNVPLYKAMYERYKGYALPPPAALERQMESLGVPPKQKERARQAFSSSANFAGYIAQNGRFIQPVPAKDLTPDENDPASKNHLGGGGGGGDEDPPPLNSNRKPLEYELVDLLQDKGVDDVHREAIWTLVRFLAERKRDEQDKDRATDG